MIVKYIVRDDEYRIYREDYIGSLIMTVPADCVAGFADLLPKQPEEYRLLAYIGYGIAKAALDNENPMLDSIVNRYGGRFDDQAREPEGLQHMH